MENILCAALACISCLVMAQAQNTSTTPHQTSSQPPQKANKRTTVPTASSEPFDTASVAKMNEQCVTLRTEAGDIVLEMLADTAPETARNFLNLAAIGAYDTTTFSRVVKDFIIQGGDLATHRQLTHQLSLRARRSLHDEPNPIKHTRGIVSMARSQQPNSATTNFFILVGDAPHLDGVFAAFARVRIGMDVVETINNRPAEGEKPTQPARITRAEVSACPQANKE